MSQNLEVNTMELPSTVNKLIAKVEKHAEDIGLLYGVGGGLKRIANQFYGGSITDAIQDHVATIGDLDFEEGIFRVTHLMDIAWSAPIAKNAVNGAILGYVVKELQIDPRLTRAGKAMYNASLTTGFSLAGLAFVTGLAKDHTIGGIPHDQPTRAQMNKWTRKTENSEIENPYLSVYA